jgi:hypothetical protein
VKKVITHTRFGFAVAILTAATTLITFGIAILTPPLSGPFCASGCFDYPYHEIISRFPRDYYWMYPTILISLLFILLMGAIHQQADDGKKLFSLTAWGFALLSAAVLIPNYFLQISVIQPSLLNGETDGIALLSQFNPHGIFIALEEVGFIFMNLAFLAIIPVFSGKRGVFRAIRLTGLIAFLLVVTALVFISINHGIRREYMFEVAVISIVWTELILNSVLLSIVFGSRKQNR